MVQIFGFSIKARIIFMLLVIDLIFNAITPSIYLDWYLMLIFAGIQAALILGVAAIFYTIISRTLFFRAGLFFGVMKHISLFLVSIGAHILCTLLWQIARVVLSLLTLPDTHARAGQMVKEAVWWEGTYAWYWLLFYIQQIVAALYYAAVMINVSQLSDDKLYIPQVG